MPRQSRPRPVIRWLSRFADIDSMALVTVYVDGSRYEYRLHALAADNAEYLFKHASALKGLGYVKRHAIEWSKV
jgi:hypothetical protein